MRYDLVAGLPAALPPAACVLSAALLLGCASGQLKPTTCDISSVALEAQRSVPRGVDVEYRVRGRAGTPAVVWLAARRGPQDYLSGPGVDVGPGPFEAIVGLKLTAPAPEYVATLELADGSRCLGRP